MNYYKDNYNIIQSIDNRVSFPSEMKDKMKQSKIDKGISKKIYSLNLSTKEIQIWQSIKDCSKILNVDRRSIQNILKLEDKYSSKGYTFSYTTEFKKEPKIKGGSPSKKVYVYDNIKTYIGEYNSILECSKTLHTSRPFISKYLDTDLLYNNRYFYSCRLSSQ